MDLTEQLNSLLVGRRIEKGDETSLILDNGTVLDFHPYGECCAYAEVQDVAQQTNVITSVQLIPESDELRIYALVEGSGGSDLFKVVGSEGSGYYCYGVELRLDGSTVLDIDQPFS